MRSLTYYIATSLDGFIAAPDGTTDDILNEGEHITHIVAEFPETLPTFTHEHFGIRSPGNHFDTVLMGWNTYAVGLAQGIDSPYAHLRQHVFSRHRKPVPSDVTLHQDDPVAVVRQLKAKPGDGGGIWLCGGGSLAGHLITEIDALILKITPRVFGTGIPLFAGAAYSPLPFERHAVQTFANGVTILTLRRIQ